MQTCPTLALGVCGLLALTGCHSVKWEGSSTGYYSTISTPVQAMVSSTEPVSSEPAASQPQRQELSKAGNRNVPVHPSSFASKSIEDLGLSADMLNRIARVTPPKNDSYMESLRVMSSVKDILDAILTEMNSKQFGYDRANWPSPNQPHNRHGIGLISNQQLYAIAGASIIKHIGMNAQLAIVERQDQSEGIIVISESLAIDLLSPAVQSVGDYLVKRVYRTDLNQPLSTNI